MTTQSDILGKLFGSAVRVKVMKFFLLNPTDGYTIADISDRLRVKSALIQREMPDLVKSGFIKSKVVVKIIVGKRKTSRKKMKGFIANPDFTLAEPLRELLVDAGGVHIPSLPSRFAGTGNIKFLAVSGIFLRDHDRTMDLVIAGDRLSKKSIDAEIKKMEAEIGKELRYAVFDTSEFIYRLNMYDKLVRDVIEFPHQKVINKVDHPELRR